MNRSQKNNSRSAPVLFDVIMTSFFMLMIYEGAVRKWVLPALSMPIQIIRDLLLGFAFLVLLLKGQKKSSLGQPDPLCWILFWVYVALAILQMINPAIPSIFIPFLGLRTHFSYFFLMLLLPLYLGTLENGIKRMTTGILILAIPVCLLAFYQTTRPASDIINIYASGEEANATFGNSYLVRASGTFAYLTGMGYFAQMSLVLSVMILLLPDLDRSKRWIATISAGLGLMACFATGSRGTVFGAVLQILLVFMFCKGSLVIFLSRYGKSFFPILLAVLAVTYLSSSQIDAFFERVDTSAGDEGWRINDLLTEWMDVLANNPWGVGLGMGHQQAATFVGGQAGFSSSLPEVEPSRIALELGILGFIAFLCFRLAVLIMVIKILYTRRKYELKLFCSLSLAMLLPLTLGGMYTPMANALYWAAIGLALWAKQIDDMTSGVGKIP